MSVPPPNQHPTGCGTADAGRSICHVSAINTYRCDIWGGAFRTLTWDANMTHNQIARGNDCLFLQALLYLWGYYPQGTSQAQAVDGYFGQRTFDAVVNFQCAHNIDPDGIVGSGTWSVLQFGQQAAPVLSGCAGDVKCVPNEDRGHVQDPNKNAIIYPGDGQVQWRSPCHPSSGGPLVWRQDVNGPPGQCCNWYFSGAGRTAVLISPGFCWQPTIDPIVIPDDPIEIVP